MAAVLFLTEVFFRGNLVDWYRTIYMQLSSLVCKELTLNNHIKRCWSITSQLCNFNVKILKVKYGLGHKEVFWLLNFWKGKNNFWSFPGYLSFLNPVLCLSCVSLCRASMEWECMEWGCVLSEFWSLEKHVLLFSRCILHSLSWPSLSWLTILHCLMKTKNVTLKEKRCGLKCCHVLWLYMPHG